MQDCRHDVLFSEGLLQPAAGILGPCVQLSLSLIHIFRGPLLAKKIGIEINPERIDAAVEVFVIVVKLRN